VIERAVSRTVEREPALVRGTAARTPKAWGALAAAGVLSFRELAGRAPDDGEVCGGLLLCIDCARTHLCTSECAARGCLPGLCVREVRDGVVAAEFGVR
jgi:hypothetical protein